MKKSLLALVASVTLLGASAFANDHAEKKECPDAKKHEEEKKH